MTFDPTEAQSIHRQDQIGAALRVWAETVAAARDQLLAVGFTPEQSVGIATMWTNLVIAHNLGGLGRVA